MISELANHLWLSTLFVVAVWLLTMMCRRNQASVRYWLWFGASVKFLIPFTVLMALGDRLEWASRGPQIATPAVSATIAQVSRPFVVDPTVGLLSVQEAPRSFDWFAVALLGVWLTGAIAIRSDLCAGAGTRQRIVGPRLRQSQVESPGGAGGGQCTPPGPPGPVNMRICGVTMAQFVERMLPMYAGRMVVDKTGLTGGFDLALYFDNRPLPGVGPGGGLPARRQADAPAAPDPDAVSIFTALEEQLGLKLVSETGPMEVLVIDRVERPTPN